MVDEGEDSCILEDADSFHDLYHSVENIELSDGLVMRDIKMPFVHKQFQVNYPISATSSGMQKQAMYAYAIAKFCRHYNYVYDQLEEAAFLLKLVMWMWDIVQLATVTQSKREQCFMKSGVEVVVTNVLPFTLSVTADV